VNHVDLASDIKLAEIDRPDLIIATDTNMNDPVTAKYAHDLAFMEQEVEFMVLKTADKTAPNPLVVGVNGPFMTIWRGKRYTAARKFLNAMISTFTDVDTHEYIDEKGLSQTRVETVTSPSLQIQVLNDPAGVEGMEWFARAQHGTY
jgi:hypothetical protein